jgi:DNA polymerase-1
VLRQHLQDGYLGGHTLAYDTTVLLAHLPPALRYLVRELYDDRRVIDLWLAWKLLLNARGKLQDDHPLPGSVAALGSRFLGTDRVEEKKDPDSPRFTYGRFRKYPVWEYNYAHQKYALDDAGDEAGLMRPMLLEWRKEIPDLQHLADVPDLLQCARKHFTTALSDAWGFRTDGDHVQGLREQSEEAVDKGREKLVELGLYRANGTKNARKVRRMVEHAFGRQAVITKYSVEMADKVDEALAAFEDWLADHLTTIGNKTERNKAEGEEWDELRKLPDPPTGKYLDLFDDEIDPPFPGGDAYVDVPWMTYFGAAPKTATGLVSTKDEILARVTDEDAYVAAYASYQKDEKLLNSFIPKLELAAVEPFHATTDPIKSTGRTSVRGIPYQQIPRAEGIRESFSASDGYLLCASDISIAELRCLAQILLWVFGRSRMAELLQEGKELHLATAAALLKIPYEEALARKKDKEVKEARQLSKALNFGLPGGLGAKSFRDYARNYGVKLTEEESKELKNWWLEQYPEMRLYLNDIGAMCSNTYQGHLQRWNQMSQSSNARGRYTAQWIFRWPDITDTGEGRVKYIQPVSKRIRLIEGGRTYSQTANTGFQGLNGDVTLEAAWRVTRECFFPELESVLFGCRVIAIIHDEIIAEVPIHKAPACAARIRDIIVSTMNEYLPDIPAIADMALMRRWSKAAEPAFSDTGVLIPWEDRAA